MRKYKYSEVVATFADVVPSIITTNCNHVENPGDVSITSKDFKDSLTALKGFKKGMNTHALYNF